MLQTKERLLRDKRQHVELIAYFKDKLNFLPEGYAYCGKKNGRLYYTHAFRSNGQRSIASLSSKNPSHMQRLQFPGERQIIKKSLPILEKNVKALEKCLKKYQVYDPTQICSSLALAYKGTDLRSLWLKGNIDPQTWKDSLAQNKDFYPEGLFYEAEPGLKVRSKSESIIALSLSSQDIPFLYEAGLMLNGRIVHPDFTILRLWDRRILYWEHFGMMDDPTYTDRAYKKIVDYSKHGICPGKNLLMTFESRESPLDIQEVQDIIRLSLLCNH